MKKKEKGVALIITLMVMIIIVAIMVGVGIILVNRLNLTGNIADSVPAFYVAHGGIEKVWHYVPNGTIQEVCNICNVCPNPTTAPGLDPVAYCDHCTTTPLATGGCQVDFDAVYDGKKNAVSVTATCPYTVTIFSTGFYNDIVRQTSITRKENDLAPQFCATRL